MVDHTLFRCVDNYEIFAFGHEGQPMLRHKLCKGEIFYTVMEFASGELKNFTKQSKPAQSLAKLNLNITLVYSTVDT